MHGYVRSFDAERKFGFIRIHPNVDDFFFHQSDCAVAPSVGQRVNFWLDDDPYREDKLRAVDIQIAQEAA